MSEAAPQEITPIVPLPYHRAVVEYLKEAEPELWSWASSAEAKDEFSDQLRTELLKANYRLDADGHPELLTRCTAVAERLGIGTRVTLYQATGGGGMNACIYHLPGEAHIVFTGSILGNLQGPELDAVLARELAHFRLWEMDGGAYMTADRLLIAAANDPRGASSHTQTARRFRLYTEIAADRGALAGSGHLEATVAALVKTETGLPEVSAVSYLKQADEIFAREDATTRGIEHPETFIRARALRLFSERDPSLEAWLSSVIEGATTLDDIDLPGQVRLSRSTSRLLAELLRPPWFQTAPILAHARAFFSDLVPNAKPDEGLISELGTMHDRPMKEYLSYLLLDFAVVDPELEKLPLAAAVDWSARLGVAEEFEKLAVKELRLGKRQWNNLKKEAAASLAQAEAQK